MNPIQLSQEAQLHREAYIAALNGLLSTPTSKRVFAKQIGISPQHLSYLLNPNERTPSPELAQRIVAALSLETEARNSLLEHLLLASERRLQAHQQMQQTLTHVDPVNSLDFLRQLERTITFFGEMNQVKSQREILRISGVELLTQCSSTRFPLESAQVCLWLNDVENAIDLPANALYYAKKARLLLERVNRHEFRSEERQNYDMLLFNAMRCEAVAYHNLKLERSAYELCCEVESSHIIKQNGKDWLPHLYRDKINAYCRTPRFSIRQVEVWVNQGRDLCQQVAHPQAQLWAFMLERSLVEAYLHYGITKKTEVLRVKLADEIDHLPIQGPLHRVSFLRTSAMVFWKKGDMDAWREVVSAALCLAIDAGLTHQVHLFHQQYGDKLRSITEQLQP